ncbi:DNA polymerase I [Clavibacter tessellarius]|uniref:DNA polymerase I n=1 Tax=Clavibacter tessellarius TaxID=31965 RepID=A0A225CMI6_9MICO|nr:DNA polymerase I [Clavibacter michiganensis]OQJ63606.1 DNA polymerase I [Clavibacter michiganensis subsp. tessellarius]UKF33416.1 DNA polymerase I [Clavibacter michiganensis subsp. tessellarius]
MPNTEKPTLLVIDGHSLAFRAFYALPAESFQNREGQHTNAVHGFIAMLINLLQKEKPTHVGVAFDISRFSFRTREYPEYKGTRGETPMEFTGQVPLLERALKTMNIPTLTKEDHEADDILATLATQGREQGFRVLVVSGDRDAIQLVNDDVTLLYPSTQGVSQLTRYDAEKVFEKYGVQPGMYPDIAALVGETSDNLIGVDKVGPKTAVKWLNQYGSLDAVLEHRDEIPGKVGDNLRAQYENVIRNRRLNRLLTDVELPLGPADLERKPIDEPALREVFQVLEFKQLLDRVLKLEGSGASASSEGTPVGAVEQEPSTAPAAPQAQQLLDEELEKWIRTQVAASPHGLGLTVETQDGKPVGFGIASATESVTLPWQEGRADYAPFERWLASDAPKIMADAKVQVKAMRRAGLAVAGLAFDVLVAGWLLRPGFTDKTLAALVSRYLLEDLPEPDANQLVPETEALTAPTEAWYTLRVEEALRQVLDERTLGVMVDIEMPTLLVLVEMELRGVATDRAGLAELSAQLQERITDLAQRAFAEIGKEINLGSPKQLQEVLFDQLGMPKTRANKTGFSTDAGALADLQASNPHPFLDLLLEHRDASKLRQIIQTLERGIGDDERIHTTYVQTGTTTGRISSNDPNLQNIPVRTEEGRRIRSAIRVGEGYETLLTADYSQIEMRIMAHLSGDEGLIEAFAAGEDLHRFVGSRIFGVTPADVSAEMRTKVKAMSYGLAYGLSAFGLSKQLRIPSSEAKQLMTDYFARFGSVRDYLRQVVEEARAAGYTETIFGRRRPFPDLNSPNRVLRDNAERAALNAPIQGSAADIMKIAMIRIEADMRERDMASRMLLQVHDELILEVAPGEWDALEAIVTDRMAHAADLRVPLEVQVGRGDSWAAAAH